MKLESKPRDCRHFPPPPFPSGWFRVAFSDELLPGKVMPLYYFGRHLVLFRTKSGIAHVLDAYCPHMGAHLGYGGYVNDNTIYCPFHEWGFNYQGSCVKVPYSHKTPSKVKIATWPVCEVDGLIMVYYHPKKEPPSWEFPGIQGWNSREWSSFTRLTRKLRAHVQEFAQNIVDDTHFLSVHNFTGLKQTALEITGAFFRRSLIWKTSLGGSLRIKINTKIELTELGLGCVVAYPDFNSKIGKIEFIIVSLFTPIDEQCVEVTLLNCSKKILWGLGNPLLNKITIAYMDKQESGDYLVFENKIYPKHILLDEEDGPIAKYQNWARQFYPKDSRE